MSSLCSQSPQTQTTTADNSTTTENNLFQELKASWSKPLSKTCTAKDVARLSTRIDVSVANNSPTTSTPETKHSTSSNDTRTEAILTVVRQLSVFFSVDAESAIENTTAATSENPDLSSWVESLLKNLGGDASPIVRVFKCMHQNILFIGIYELKLGVLKDVPTKDSRTEDGWRIRVTAEEGRVQVTHQRKEALCDVPGTLQWAMSLTFDGQMTELCSTSLRLTGLSLEKHAKPKDRQVLMTKLSSGNLIIR